MSENKKEFNLIGGKRRREKVCVCVCMRRGGRGREEMCEMHARMKRLDYLKTTHMEEASSMEDQQTLTLCVFISLLA
ncbi:hypothetical protein Hanom_Chr08g00751311 [Helianthus anomalus]